MTERVDRLVAELTLDEKATLTAGVDMWTTAGVRTPRHPGDHGDRRAQRRARHRALRARRRDRACASRAAPRSAPRGTPALVERVGVMLGEEALTKACRALLAPTVNIHRSPTGGRNFECYSEDPLLSGKTAAAFVRGVQSQGVVTTVKHFAGNDAEFERNTDQLGDRPPRAARDLPRAVRARGARRAARSGS